MERQTCRMAALARKVLPRPTQLLVYKRRVLIWHATGPTGHAGNQRLSSRPGPCRMKEIVSHSLFDYWNGIRGDRLAPKRFEIEPSAIAAILPDTLILERIDTATCCFRLAGTRIGEAFGIEFRGVNIIDMFSMEDRITLQRQLSVIARQGAVGVFTIVAESETGLSCTFELIVLPLTHTRDVVDRFLGAISTAERPRWLGTVPLVKRRISEHTLVWPNGRSHATIDNVHKQAPFKPYVQEARVVRFDRRQFRVYDGGLSRTDDE
jgi:hypothetical protein